MPSLRDIQQGRYSVPLQRMGKAMTDKPERMEIWLAEDAWPDNQSVIKAEDYDALAAQSAADKARIAELQAALRKVAGEVDGNIRECVRDCVNQRGNVQDIYDYCDNIDTAIDAVLAQQGKENTDGQ